jgi:hypothetical protein
LDIRGAKGIRAESSPPWQKLIRKSLQDKFQHSPKHTCELPSQLIFLQEYQLRLAQELEQQHQDSDAQIVAAAVSNTG